MLMQHLRLYISPGEEESGGVPEIILFQTHFLVCVHSVLAAAAWALVPFVCSGFEIRPRGRR